MDDRSCFLRYWRVFVLFYQLISYDRAFRSIYSSATKATIMLLETSLDGIMATVSELNLPIESVKEEQKVELEYHINNNYTGFQLYPNVDTHS
jgi:hypothetical protein